MSIDNLKAEAKQLYVDALASDRPVPHYALLQAIAHRHGASNWRNLVLSHGNTRPRIRHWFHEAAARFKKIDTSWHIEDLLYGGHSTDGVSLGVSTRTRKPLEVTDDKLRRHLLLVGGMGHGMSVLLENILLQQVARGGGFICLVPFMAGDQIRPLAKTVSRLNAPLHMLNDFRELTPKLMESAYDNSMCVLPEHSVFHGPRIYAKPGERITPLSERLLEVVQSILSDQEGKRKKHPFLVVLPSFWDIYSNKFEILMAQARAIGISFVIIDHGLQHFDPTAQKGEMGALLQNTCTKVLFGVSGQHSGNRQADCLGLPAEDLVKDWQGMKKTYGQLLANSPLGSILVMSGNSVEPVLLQKIKFD